MTKFNRILFSFILPLVVISAPALAADLPFVPGEKIYYSVKQYGIKAGDAVLEFKGETYLEGQRYTLITFVAKGFNFYDEERIYTDPVTLLPHKVMRDLNIFGNKETIMEEYRDADGFIRVTKTANGKTTIQDISITNNAQVDNIYTFLYRIRLRADIKTGQEFDLHLPTMTLRLQGEREVSFNALGKKYQSVLFRSLPPKYTIWFDPGPQKLPLRISGSIGLANTVMVITGYDPK
ncbi:MAG: DUF3108 domain-containing protein [Candidatus Omnitrophica bacterium]|nr:DUF3108 domain-containing protein [Candidatus Omnitrophota bacterium]